MNLHWIPVKNKQLWPLHQETSCGEQLIADSTFLEQQRAQFKLVNAEVEVNLPENAWVSWVDWQKLIRVSAPAVLQSENGDVLAWIGDGDIQTCEGVVASEKSFLICYPWQFLDVNELLISELQKSNFRGEVSPAAHIDGIVQVGKGSTILPGVVIEGNVVIGKNCKIGPNCYLRGSTTIGDNVHIGQAVEVKNSIVGHRSSLGHLSYVGDSILGNDVNLGAGTITSNFRHDGNPHRSMIDGKLQKTNRLKLGAILGNDVHTGIHTAIYPGRKLAPHATTQPNETVRYDVSE